MCQQGEHKARGKNAHEKQGCMPFQRGSRWSRSCVSGGKDGEQGRKMADSET